ncbi:hypothetical protein T484DRAFT_1983759 [Baffinella frigidus]|nr:hypothetical protein T484DRAFT_1983759 [Cryptophyta sp. CCMP2293]
MTEAEACGWVRRRVPAWEGDEAGVLELVRKLGCLPLSIEQAAAFVKEYRIKSPALYLAEQAEHSSVLRKKWGERRLRGGEYLFSFAEVISLTFAKLSLETDDDDKSVGAIELLRKMAFFHTDGIPADLFKVEEWVHVSTLARHSLVLDIGAGGLSMHAMTQEVVRDLLMGGSKATVLGEVLAAFHVKMAKFDVDLPGTYDVGRVYAPHVKAAVRHIKQGETQLSAEDDLLLANVCKTTGVFLGRVACSFREALELHMQSRDIRVKVLGEDHTFVATAYHHMAIVCCSQGKHDEALEHFLKSFAINIKVLGPHHEDVAASYNNLANVYESLGKYDEGLKFFEKGLDLNIKVHGPDHPHVAASYDGTAEVYSKQGKYEDALKLRQMSLAINVKVHGPEHPSMSCSYDGMAVVYRKQGKFHEALELYQKCLDIDIKAMGKDHPYVADSYDGMAEVYEALGKLEEAREMQQKSAAIRSA